MCVIMVVQKTRPTDDMIQKAWDSNPDGGGVAWREANKKGETIVRWHKGIMKFEEMKDIMQKLPLPYVAHFRIASVGGVKQTLTHPFLISRDAELALQGGTKSAVLFHNGHWGAWSEKTFDAAIMSNTPLPTGDWSDTRALAWLMHIYGPGVMEILPSQKGVFFTPTKTDVFVGGGWVEIDGVWCSNETPRVRKYRTGNHGNHQSHTTYNYCSMGKCYNKAQDGKEICYSCESRLQLNLKHGQKEKETTITADPPKAGSTDGSKPVGQTQVTSLALIRGGQQTKDPLSQALTLAEAEGIFIDKGMSKSQINKFRKLYGQLRRAQSDKRKGKLLERILEHSNEVAEGLVHG